MPVEDVLSTAPRCVLAQRGGRWPAVASLPFWSDGAALWMATPAATAALRRDPVCAVHVPAPDDEGGDGLRIDGRARVFGPHDPVGLVLHAPTLSAVLVALSLKHAGAIAGRVGDVVQVGARSLPLGWVVVKVVIDRLRRSRPPSGRGGIAPPLPPVVPAELRRAVGGRRDATLAVQGVDGVEVGPVRLGAGFALDTGMAWTPAPGPGAVVVEASPPGRPAEVTGLRLSGDLTDDGRLVVRRAAWWQGATTGGADVPTRPAGVVLPD